MKTFQEADSDCLSRLKVALKPFRTRIESSISQYVDQMGPKNGLQEGCRYALLNGGKRFRPVLVLLVAEALQHGFDAIDAAMAVEFFHCASLVADDLPCMDNEEQRREKPTLHKVYDEATALLVTYALIAAGYESLQRNARLMASNPAAKAFNADRICVLASSNATYNTGAFGATGGQYLDILAKNPSLDLVKEVICRKTVSLFEVAFVFGWLFGGGDEQRLDEVKKLAYHYGMAFQIADDLNDMQQDLTNGKQINMALVLGEKAAASLLQQEAELYQHSLSSLHIASPELTLIGQWLVGGGSAPSTLAKGP